MHEPTMKAVRVNGHDDAQVSLLCCECAQGLIINLYKVAYTGHSGHSYSWCDKVDASH